MPANSVSMTSSTSAIAKMSKPVMQARYCATRLAAVVHDNLGVFPRDLFERFQAISSEAGHDTGNATHTVLCQLLDGLVGVRLQPLVKPEPRLEGEQQLGRAHA